MRSGLLALLLLLPLAGCMLPKHGTPVLVDSFAGDYWSGKGRLLEVSEDRTRCRVAARTRSLVVSKEWVPCTSVHPMNSR